MKEPDLFDTIKVANWKTQNAVNQKAVETVPAPKVSQETGILQYLQAGGSLTPMDGLRLFNCWALSSRCSDLRKKGYAIISRLEHGENGKIYARYFIK